MPKERDKLIELWSTAEKIFAQELRKGCADQTVLGGLEKFLSRWVSSVASLENAYPTWPEAKQIAFLLDGYSRKPVSDREDAVRAACSLSAEVTERIKALSTREPLPSVARQGDAGNGPHPLPLPHGERGAKTLSQRERGFASRSPREKSIASRSGLRTQDSGLNLDDPIIALKGVGKQRASRLTKLGIAKIRDLLYHFPRSYRDYRTIKRIVDLLYGETASIVGMVEDVQVVPGPKKLFRTTVKVRDETGRMSATWFRHGYGGVRVAPNSRIAVAGTVTGYGAHLNLESPDWELADRHPLHTRRMVPVYPLTEGISDYWLREIMAGVVPAVACRLEEHLPEWLVKRYSLYPLAEAVEKTHFPASPEESERARRRLAFDELFFVQLAALKVKTEWQEGARAIQLRMDEGAIEQFLAHQPFTLTQAQRRVIDEIRADLALPRPMSRLLQGDVGSGKTIVAAVAMLVSVVGGCQAALMAPTEILAEQHARTLRSAYANAGAFVDRLLGRQLRLELLTGASRSSEKERIYEETASGKVDILVGTQALIQEGLGFNRLGLVVIDEQHRFGVAQRSALRDKGGSPHLLVMTATPIPRTLALVMYGDLDLSIIDELPPGRQQVKTHLLGPLERTVAYEHIRREVAKGRQAFIICPLVEDSPHLEVRAAT
ncbi:MAG: ATP-dependent DNA helicase RecG, partial [Chloroflexota bacterium]